jgi:ribonuclease P protein component
MQRLKTRPQFQAVLAGAQVAKTSHFALHRLDLDTTNNAPAMALFCASNLWMGAMTPKRWAKRAVTRNAIKRQIYTVSASISTSMPQAAFVVRLRREFSRQEFASATSIALKEAVRVELLTLLRVGQALG